MWKHRNKAWKGEEIFKITQKSSIRAHNKLPVSNVLSFIRLF